MADTLDERLIDRRTWDRYVRNGQLDEKEYERYLKNLPDVAEKATNVETVMDASDEEPVPPAATTP